MSKIADEFLSRRPELLDIGGARGVSPASVRRMAALAAPLARYFRFRARGLERVPEGGALIVANHSSGAGFEIPMLLRAWRLALGDRPARGLVHRVGFQLPLRLARIWRFGGVLAHPAIARRVLERGQPLLVFPGGDLDVCRPFGDRYRVVFGRRTGFIRLARETGVPVLPLAICGSHAAYIQLPGARAVARWTGAARLLGLHRSSRPVLRAARLPWPSIGVRTCDRGESPRKRSTRRRPTTAWPGRSSRSSTRTRTAR